MNFEHSIYLPNSEKQIGKLRQIVSGRPVCILASGPSISELETRISELRNIDICWFGFNTFVHEKCILSQLGEEMDLYMDSCRENIPFTINEITEFLNRGTNNLFISTLYRNSFQLLGGDLFLDSFRERYSEKLLFFYLAASHDVPSKENPLHFIEGNSLQMAIQIAIISKASHIFLFGADGGARTNKLYYRQESYTGLITPPPEKVLQDTVNHFNPAMPISIKNTCATYDIPMPLFFNVSPGTLYTAFPICNYDTAFSYLKRC